MKNKFHEKQVTAIAQAMLELAANEAVLSEIPDLGLHARSFMAAVKEEDSENALMNLYIHLHSTGSKYSASERKLLKRTGGYSCLPGGLSPLIKANEFIRPESIVADLGAGNGLQGLLLQRLYPHRKTMQIELSKEMLRIGRIFQQALGLSNECMEWINDDISNVSIEDADFIYMYRPARPLEAGHEIYRCIAEKLSAVHKPLVIFSVADCLGRYLDKKFSMFYTDGHLTCFRG